jgi:hypothetical protein
VNIEDVRPRFRAGVPVLMMIRQRRRSPCANFRLTCVSFEIQPFICADETGLSQDRVKNLCSSFLLKFSNIRMNGNFMYHLILLSELNIVPQIAAYTPTFCRLQFYDARTQYYFDRYSIILPGLSVMFSAVTFVTLLMAKQQ